MRSLTDALRKVRLAETERTDVVVELREAERARLDMLADELKGVFTEIPAENDQFIFQNTTRGQVNFLFWDVSAPAWVWLVLLFALGMVVGSLFPWGRRKQKD